VIDAHLPPQPSPEVVDEIRRWLAEQIRSRVVGSDAAERGAAIFDAPGPRWVPAGSPARLVHADASMFIGGLRALLLQSLHPLAMAGVADHSDYRTDPWGRLQRTADFLAVTTYGPAAMAEQAVATVHRVHRHVVGVAPDGRPYAANDPHLLGWVHVAETDSFLAAYRRFGGQPLDRAGADAYVHDVAPIARALGVVDPPTTVAELRAQLAGYRPELRSTDAARRAARFLIFEPPLPLVVRPAYLALATAAVALLPAWARWPLRLPLLPVSERLVVGPVGAAATSVIRWTMQHPA
jgi:uncharacterized protein (DUF2236 family)